MKYNNLLPRLCVIMIVFIISALVLRSETFNTTTLRVNDSAPISESWSFNVDYDARKISWTESSGENHSLQVDTVYSKQLPDKINRYIFEGTENQKLKKVEVNIPFVREGKKVSIRLYEEGVERFFSTDVYTPSIFWNIFWVTAVFIGGGLYFFIGYKKFKKSGSRYLLNATPGVFTSLGILGTFMSICFSLWRIDAETFEITIIINELIPAFTTSIAGIIGAIIATWINKSLFAIQDEKEEQRIGLPEKNLHDINEKLDKLGSLDIIVNRIERLELNQTILKDSLIDKIQRVIGVVSTQENVNRELNANLISTISQQSTIIKNFVAEFVSKMDEVFGRIGESIERQMNEFGEQQFNESRVTVENLMTRLTEVSESIINSQSESITSILDRTNESLESFRSSNQEQMEQLKNHMQSANEEALRNNEYSVQQMTNLREEFAKMTSDMMRDIESSNENVINSIADKLNRMVDAMDSKVQSVCQNLADTVSAYLNSLKENYSFMIDQTASIRSNYEQATLSFTNAVEDAHNFNRSHEALLDQLNDGLLHLENTNKNISKVLEIVERRQVNIDHLVQRIVEMSAAIDKLQELESTLHRLAVI